MTPFSEIPRRSRHCMHGQEPFKPGMEYFSLIKAGDSGVLIRSDYCLKCWEELDLKQKTYWKARIPQQCIEAQPSSIPETSALDKLKELIAKREKEEDIENAFILALYLERKKRLVQRQQIQDSKGVFILYEVKETEELLLVPRADLSALDIKKIICRVDFLFLST